MNCTFTMVLLSIYKTSLKYRMSYNHSCGGNTQSLAQTHTQCLQPLSVQGGEEGLEVGRRGRFGSREENQPLPVPLQASLSYVAKTLTGSCSTKGFGHYIQSYSKVTTLNLTQAWRAIILVVWFRRVVPNIDPITVPFSKQTLEPGKFCEHLGFFCMLPNATSIF